MTQEDLINSMIVFERLKEVSLLSGLNDVGLASNRLENERHLFESGHELAKDIHSAGFFEKLMQTADGKTLAQVRAKHPAMFRQTDEVYLNRPQRQFYWDINNDCQVTCAKTHSLCIYH